MNQQIENEIWRIQSHLIATHPSGRQLFYNPFKNEYEVVSPHGESLCVTKVKIKALKLYEQDSNI